MSAFKKDLLCIMKSQNRIPKIYLTKKKLGFFINKIQKKIN